MAAVAVAARAHLIVPSEVLGLADSFEILEIKSRFFRISQSSRLVL